MSGDAGTPAGLGAAGMEFLEQGPEIGQRLREGWHVLQRRVGLPGALLDPLQMLAERDASLVGPIELELSLGEVDQAFDELGEKLARLVTKSMTCSRSQAMLGSA